DFVHLAETADRQLAELARRPLLGLLRHHVGQDWPGCDRVHADSLRRDLTRQGLRESDYTCLARAVVHHLHAADLAELRSDVDHVAAAPLEHARQYEARAEED